MTVSVEISDRLYDYTDEEKAAEAIAFFQEETGLSDIEILTLWRNSSDSRRSELEGRIFDAVDANGSVKRALEAVPGGISLAIS